MQKQQFNPALKSEVAVQPQHLLPPFLKHTSSAKHRKLRVVLPALPRPERCLAERRKLAEARAAELALWSFTGGDFLRSSVSTNLVQNWQARPT